MDDIDPWLTALGLEQYIEAFRRHEIDLHSLALLSDTDLEKIGVSLGARRKILKALAISGGPAEPERVDLPVAERRHLTVLFCDMVGSTEYADRLDPEDFRRLVETFMQSCSAVTRRHRGLVASYIGDAVKSYFGYPVADEDDAERAVLAGLEMLETVAAIAPAHAEPLRARLGVASGRVVIGSLAGAPAGVSTVSFGHVAHLAARLQTLAAPNSLLADAATFQAANGAVEFADFGRHALKGFADPVQVWQARRPRSVESRFAKRTGFTKLCGRDHEMRILADRWAQVSSENSGQVVFISGEAGIGKSRLLNELQRRLQRSSQLIVQCVPAFENSPLYPFLTELNHRAGIADGVGPDEKLEKLGSALSVSEVPLDISLPIFAGLLSIPFSGSTAPLSTIGAVRQRAVTTQVFRDWIAHEARAAPLLMLFEDEQWADRTSRELLDALIESLGSIAVLILVSTRADPEVRSSGSTRALHMTLGPLNSDEARTLIHDMNPGDPPTDEVVASVLDRAEGVPLYLEELTRSAVETGLPFDTTPRRRLAGGDIPSSLQSSLLARLDKLGPAKEIAQIAATIGRDFDLDLLAETTSQSHSSLRTQLAYLVRSGLIVTVEGEKTESRFSFSHALLQQAAADTILRERRQQLHALIASTMEKRDPAAASAHPEFLAQHFDNAALYDRAADYWLLAGLKAGKTWAKVEAAQMFGRGIEAAMMLPESEARRRRLLHLELERGDVLYAAFGYVTGEGSAAYHRAIQLSEELGDPEAPIRALDGLFGTHFNSGQFSDSIGASDRLIDIGETRGNLKALVLGFQFKGMSLFCQGELISARQYLQRALDHKASADEVGSDFPSMSMIYLAWTMHILGSYPEALALFREAEAVVRSQSAYRLAAWLGDGCILFALREESAAVVRLTDELMPLARENGFHLWSNFARFFKGWAMATIEGLVAGTSLMSDTVKALEDQEVDKSSYLGLLAEAYLQTNQIEQAAETVAEGLKQADKIGEHYYTAELLRLRGDVEVRQAKLEAAETSYRDAITFAQRQAARHWELKATRSLLRLFHAQGRPREAEQLLRPIIDWFEQQEGRTIEPGELMAAPVR